MDDKFMEILLLLNDSNDWITSANIALYTGYSQRTIKNYIQKINTLHPAAVLSSRKGYRINTSKKEMIFKKFQLDDTNNLQTLEGRRDFLLLKLLKHDTSINIFDLSELLFCSVTTIKNDIKKINSELVDDDIKIITSGDYLSVIGNQQNKKKVFIERVYEDSESNILSISDIQHIFTDLPVDKIDTILTSNMLSHAIILDDFVKNSILLHILLIVEQSKKNTYQQINQSQEMTKNDLKELSDNLLEKIGNELCIDFSKGQIYDIYILLLAKTATLSNKQITRENVNEYVTPKVNETMQNIVLFLNDYGSLDIVDDNFYIPFIIHLNGLYIRAKSGHYFKNPLLSSIRNGHPYVYELAVSISTIINQSFKEQLPDDEIAYIALHLGEALNKNRRRNHKFICALVVPNIRNVPNNLKQKIEDQFEDSLYIEHIFTKDIQYIRENNFDLVITTTPLTETIPTVAIALISPFFSTNDKKIIYFQLDDLRAKKNRSIFKNEIKKITNPDFFMNNTVLKTKEEVIDVVSDILINKKIVKEDFYTNVMEREKMSSTAFNNIAIPHTFKMEALESKVYIIVSDKPISWSKTQVVNIIFLFAVNEKDKHLFYNVFEALSSVFSDKNTLENIVKKDTYEDFINFLIKQI